jgi:Spy/CpxP family protein refolding chaperone
MSTKAMIVGVASFVCLSVALAGAETPVPAPAAPAATPERSAGQMPAPMPPICPGPMHQGPMHPGPMHQGPPAWPAEAGTRQLEWMTHVLSLSAEQKTALGKIIEQQRSQADALQGQLRDGGKKLHEALEATKPVPLTVGTLMIEHRSLMQKVEAAHDQMNQSLRALLTAEQQVRFDSMRQSGAGSRRSRGMGPMGRPQGMPSDPMGPPPVPPGPMPPPPDGGRP